MGYCLLGLGSVRFGVFMTVYLDLPIKIYLLDLLLVI